MIHDRPDFRIYDWRYGSGATQYTQFNKEFIANFAWIPDGKSLVASRETVARDVILMTE